MRESLKRLKGSFLLFAFFLAVYLFFQLQSIYGGDSGDLVTAAWLWGVPHPPGYPLYTLIGAVLVHAIPLFTPAWRMALISSFSSALALVVLWRFLLKAESQRLGATIAVVFLAFVYPFWLYSEVAEVFSLNTLLTVCLISLAWQLFKNFSFKKLLWLAFVLGLAFSHHHTAVLVLPGIFYLLTRKRVKQALGRLQLKQLIWLLAVFGLGLSFYLYPLIAAQKSPLACWDCPTNLSRLLRLITRADYGTFRSTSGSGEVFFLRPASLRIFLKLLIADFGWPALILAGLGGWLASQEEPALFRFLLINLAATVFFIFYAAFPLINEFMIATFERFLILPYLLLAILVGLGVQPAKDFFRKILERLNIADNRKPIYLFFFQTAVLLIGLTPLLQNFEKIKGLKNDFTAEEMARDFLKPLPEKSLLLLSTDTTLFNIEYVRYVLGYRPDVLVVEQPLWPGQCYYQRLKTNFPELKVPLLENSAPALKKIVVDNADRRPVLVDRNMFEPAERWLPYGLTWRYLGDQAKPAIDQQVSLNKKIWQSFSNPQQGSLKEFESLFLVNIANTYQNAGLNLANYFYNHDQLEAAEYFIQQARQFQPTGKRLELLAGRIRTAEGDCLQAEDFFLKALGQDDNFRPALQELADLYRDCFDNQEKSDFYQQKIDQLERQRGISLDSRN